MNFCQITNFNFSAKKQTSKESEIFQFNFYNFSKNRNKINS